MGFSVGNAMSRPPVQPGFGMSLGQILGLEPSAPAPQAPALSEVPETNNVHPQVWAMAREALHSWAPLLPTVQSWQLLLEKQGDALTVRRGADAAVLATRAVPGNDELNFRATVTHGFNANTLRFTVDFGTDFHDRLVVPVFRDGKIDMANAQVFHVEEGPPAHGAPKIPNQDWLVRHVLDRTLKAMLGIDDSRRLDRAA